MPEHNFTSVCKTTDVPPNGVKNVNLNGLEIAIFNTKDGFIAHSGVCKHNAFKLELCEIAGDMITCPLHGWKYRISTGKGIKPSWTCLDTYPLKVIEGNILIKPLADESNKDTFDTSAYDW
ncbi:MAG: Rieske 2Fe-2S domain-containing protein [Candidatus Marinimicrobia bacterium]|nr:Rieske 2Fe-2S domain-containing protein [Candidatus Neomarinimicrobiota bacterium]